jgi:hypothetical protein
MKKNSIFEVTVLIVGVLCMIGSLFTEDPLTQRLLKGGLYLLTGVVLTSKVLRFLPLLDQKRKLMWIGGTFLTYAAALTSFLSSFKGTNFIWLLGILLFSFSSYPEKEIPKDAGN